MLPLSFLVSATISHFVYFWAHLRSHLMLGNDAGAFNKEANTSPIKSNLTQVDLCTNLVNELLDDIFEF